MHAYAQFLQAAGKQASSSNQSSSSSSSSREKHLARLGWHHAGLNLIIHPNLEIRCSHHVIHQAVAAAAETHRRPWELNLRRLRQEFLGRVTVLALTLRLQTSP